jgi:hypothetical protein
MADTSPHTAHHRRNRNGTPRETADHPAETSHALLLDTDVAERRRWRCRHVFGGSTRAPTPTPQWWHPDPRDRIVLPANQRAA